jgi:probable phosphoglycerate mutase
MAERPRFYFVRHGETDWNVEGRLQGQRDIPINANGRGQAAEAGLKLAKAGADPHGLPWFVSPLGRTRETAEIAREAAGLPREGYALDPRLVEISFGAWEGKTWKEVRRTEAELARGRERDKWRFVPPEGESYAGLAERMRPWLDSLTEECIVVSHGGVARVLMYLVCGLSSTEAPNAEIWQGRVIVFDKGKARWV